MKLFEIQTLSESKVPKRYDPNIHYLPHGYEIRKRKYRLNDWTTLSDPVTIITGIATILPSLFPNMTGSELLTMNHLNRMFPGSGYWTQNYKNWLLQRIKYLKDVERDLHMYTGQFIESHYQEICQGGTGTTCWNNFYKLLQKEAATGGTSPVGNVLGSGFNFETLALIGGGVLLLALLTKKKSRKK